MKQCSLEAIISDMIRRLDTIRPDGQDTPSADDPLREIAALAATDPVLAALHKEYLEANSRHKKLVRENGADDAMAEVAADMLASARSAVQTRLIELQDVRESEGRAVLERRMLAKKAEQEAARSILNAEKRKNAQGADLFFWLVMFYWFMNRTIIATRRTLSAANDFAIVCNASSDQKTRVSYA